MSSPVTQPDIVKPVDTWDFHPIVLSHFCLRQSNFTSSAHLRNWRQARNVSLPSAHVSEVNTLCQFLYFFKFKREVCRALGGLYVPPVLSSRHILAWAKTVTVTIKTRMMSRVCLWASVLYGPDEFNSTDSNVPICFSFSINKMTQNCSQDRVFQPVCNKTRVRLLRGSQWSLFYWVSQSVLSLVSGETSCVFSLLKD